MVFSKIIFILNILAISTSSHRIEVKAKLLNEVLANENVPSTIVAKVSCWSKEEMVKFSMALINVLIQYLNDDVVKYQPLDDYTNKVWFFVDMKCDKSMEFIKMVRQNILCLLSYFYSINTNHLFTLDRKLVLWSAISLDILRCYSKTDQNVRATAVSHWQ